MILMFHPLMRVWIEIKKTGNTNPVLLFHPLMRVWIEMGRQRPWKAKKQFHPLMRVWIEIVPIGLKIPFVKVSPSYEGVD